MAFLSWHPRFVLGHEDIDAQHRKLFELVNHFDDVIELEMPEELGRIVDDLVAFTLVHFRCEEELMKRIGFPRSSDHGQMHEVLIRQLRELRAAMKVGGHAGAKSIVRFLADWLTNHIVREDMEYKPYLGTTASGN